MTAITVVRPDAVLGAIAQPALIALATDRETLDVISSALKPAVGEDGRFMIGDLAVAARVLSRLDSPIGALILDISKEGNPVAGLEALAQLVEPGVRVFVIGLSDTADFYRQMTREIGVTEYLAKPITRDLVARAFLPALGAASPGQIRGGRVVSVTGMRGGVGATTIAVNLATRLAEQARRHTLLFDVDLHTGSAALMLSGQTGGGLRAALEDPNRVDTLFAERASPRINDRLSLLAGEEKLDALVNVPTGAGRRLIELLAGRYNAVVVDLPRSPTALHAELRASTHVQVLVMDPTLAALRDTLRHLMLPPGPAQAAPPIVVLNRAGIPGGLSRKQIENALAGGPGLTIPWLPQELQQAATLGEPAVRRVRKFAAPIDQLVGMIEPVRDPRTGRRRWFGGRR